MRGRVWERQEPLTSAKLPSRRMRAGLSMSLWVRLRADGLWPEAQLGAYLARCGMSL